MVGHWGTGAGVLATEPLGPLPIASRLCRSVTLGGVSGACGARGCRGLWVRGRCGVGVMREGLALRWRSWRSIHCPPAGLPLSYVGFAPEAVAGNQRLPL